MLRLPPFLPLPYTFFFFYEQDPAVKQGKKRTRKSGVELCFSFKNRYTEACVCLFLLGVFVLLLK